MTINHWISVGLSSLLKAWILSLYILEADIFKCPFQVLWITLQLSVCHSFVFQSTTVVGSCLASSLTSLRQARAGTQLRDLSQWQRLKLLLKLIITGSKTTKTHFVVVCQVEPLFLSVTWLSYSWPARSGGLFDMDMSYTRVLHIKVAYRVPHKWRHAFYVTLPLLCARITYYTTVITHGRCYARA
jgi:hypothetical protein